MAEYIAEKDDKRFHVLPESMERYANEGWTIYRIEEVEVEDVGKEAEMAMAESVVST